MDSDFFGLPHNTECRSLNENISGEEMLAKEIAYRGQCMRRSMVRGCRACTHSSVAVVRGRIDVVESRIGRGARSQFVEIHDCSEKYEPMGKMVLYLS
jgi:hypothetical protein